MVGRDYGRKREAQPQGQAKFMQTIHKTVAAAIFTASLVAAGGAGAVTVEWASLTSDTGSTVSGTIADPSGSVGVTYSGGYSFDQLNGTGTDYWTTSVNDNYTQGVVNRPTDSDIIALSDANTGTITFSQPVSDVYVAFNSWNGAEVTFNHAFTVVSQGCGYWGCGTFDPNSNSNSTGFSGNGETVGVLKFAGSITSLTFTDTVSENWHGLTVGIGGAGAVPEPSAWALMLLGIGGLGATLRTRRRHPAALTA
jgi:hypothetical protein